MIVSMIPMLLGMAFILILSPIEPKVAFFHVSGAIMGFCFGWMWKKP